MKKLFTERHGAGKPRVSETLDAAGGEVCGPSFPPWVMRNGLGCPFRRCGDGYANAGTDLTKLRGTMEGYGLLWPRGEFDRVNPPSDGHIRGFDTTEMPIEMMREHTFDHFRDLFS